MPPGLILGTFNPTQKWVKEVIKEKHQQGKLEPPFYVQLLTLPFVETVLASPEASPHKDVKVDEKCKYFIEDCRFVQVRDDGSIDKRDAYSVT